MLVTQSCPILCDSMDCSPPGSSVHEIFQARILEWVTISFSRGSSQPRDQTWVSGIASSADGVGVKGVCDGVQVYRSSEGGKKQATR